jgi:hypothetical protein
MIRKSVQRFSEKIMRKQWTKARWRFDLNSSRFRPGCAQPILPRNQGFQNFHDVASLRYDDVGKESRFVLPRPEWWCNYLLEREEKEDQ